MASAQKPSANGIRPSGHDSNLLLKLTTPVLSLQEIVQPVLRSANYNFLKVWLALLFWSLAKNIITFSQFPFPPLFLDDGIITATECGKTSFFGTLFSSSSMHDIDLLVLPEIFLIS